MSVLDSCTPPRTLKSIVRVESRLSLWLSFHIQHCSTKFSVQHSIGYPHLTHAFNGFSFEPPWGRHAQDCGSLSLMHIALPSVRSRTERTKTAVLAFTKANSLDSTAPALDVVAPVRENSNTSAPSVRCIAGQVGIDVCCESIILARPGTCTRTADSDNLPRPCPCASV